MSDSQWFVQRGDARFGPYSWEQLVELARTGHVEPSDVVWRTGDPASRPARAVPGLLPAAPANAAAPGTSRRMIIALSAAAVVLAGALVAVVLTRGGDSTSSGTTEDTRPDRTTTTVTRTTDAPDSTVPATDAPSTAASTVPETATPTVAPTTVVERPLATADDLLAALPERTALPADWGYDGEPYGTGLNEASTSPWAICMGATADERARRRGVIANAWTSTLVPPIGGRFWVVAYSFPTDADASAYLADTLAQIDECPQGTSADIMEGDGPDQVDWFTEGYGDDLIIWHREASDVSVPLWAGPSDERIAVQFDAHWICTDQYGDDYRVSERVFVVSERYGTVVVVFEFDGSYDWTGFAGTTDEPTEPVSLTAFMETTDVVRPAVLGVLRSRGVIA